MSYLSLNDVDLPRKGSILDQALNLLLEGKDHRTLRREIEGRAKDRERCLKADVAAAKELSLNAAKEALEFKQLSLLGSAADLTYQPIFTTSEITEIEKRITVTSSSREAKHLNSILKHAAGIDVTNFKELLASVVKLKTKAGSGEERDSTVHEKGGRPEREDVTIGRGIRTGIERT